MTFEEGDSLEISDHFKTPERKTEAKTSLATIHYNRRPSIP